MWINPYLAGIPNRSQGSMTSYANDITMQGNHINRGCWERGSLVHNLAVSLEVVVLSHDSSGRIINIARDQGRDSKRELDIDFI